MFPQVTIVGPGLLGASLAMALRRRKACDRIVIWARSAERIEECMGEDWCDHAEENMASAVSGSSVVVVCSSVASISSLVSRIMPDTSEDMIVTDVGSVKESICKAAEKSASGASGTFIGSHPMAGSEKSGMKHAKADLFDGKPCIITPAENTPELAMRTMRSFWENLGMKVFSMNPREHDRSVAYLSHLPHLLSSSLAHCLDEIPEEWKKLAGRGLMDTTRIAEGDPELWEQIMVMNKPHLLESVSKLEKSLKIAKDQLEKGSANELREFLETGSLFRKNLDKTGQ
jgi:prephenate dehydrogenase